MNAPHAKFVEFLVAVLDLDDHEVRRMLVMDDLMAPDIGEFARLHVELSEKPDDFTVADPLHEPSVQWSRERKLLGLARNDVSVREAVRLLRSSGRLAAEVLLLAGVSTSSVSSFLAEHHVDGISTTGVEAFRRYFWATDTLAVADLVTFLRGHPNADFYTRVLGMTPDEALTLAKTLVGTRAGHMLMTVGSRFTCGLGMPTDAQGTGSYDLAPLARDIAASSAARSK